MLFPVNQTQSFGRAASISASCSPCWRPASSCLCSACFLFSFFFFFFKPKLAQQECNSFGLGLGACSSSRSFGGLIWMILSCRDSGLGCWWLIQQLIGCHRVSFHQRPCQRFPPACSNVFTTLCVNYFTNGFALDHIWWFSHGSTGSVSVTVVCSVVLLSDSDSRINPSTVSLKSVQVFQVFLKLSILH